MWSRVVGSLDTDLSSSWPCLKAMTNLLDIDPKEFDRQDFAEYFSGNKPLPGSETYAHCYCGHQFGAFSGQVGA